MGLKRGGKKPINNLQHPPPLLMMPCISSLPDFPTNSLPFSCLTHCLLFHLSHFQFQSLWHVYFPFLPSFTLSSPIIRNYRWGVGCRSLSPLSVWPLKEKKRKHHFCSLKSNFVPLKLNPFEKQTPCTTGAFIPCSFLFQNSPHNILTNCCPSLTFKAIMHHVRLQSLS